MIPGDFTNRQEVAGLITALKNDCAGKEFSDVVDDQNHQYVDIVMAGGGLLGIAIVGYLYALEAVGIRFLRIGGTSAGSITALLLAAVGTMEEAKAEELVKVLSAMDTWSFVDGGSSAQALVRNYVAGGNRLEIAFDVTRVIPTIWRREGLNPGRQFLTWLSGVLVAHGIETTAQLLERMQQLPEGFQKRQDGRLTVADITPYLALVTADVATETKVDLPRMAELYWPDWRQLNPSIYVRASMSIPFFFEPLVVENLPDGRSAQDRWQELADYDGDVPRRCAFIDGGIMSNFPIEIFHDPGRVPPAPTFGISLGGRDRTPNSFQNPWQLPEAIFDSARHCLDYDFIAKNPDYRKLVGYIDTDGFNWLDFMMADQRKVDLFERGVKAAADFLRAFDWKQYKQIREHLARAHKSGAGQMSPSP